MLKPGSITGNDFGAPNVVSGFQEFFFEVSEKQAAFYDEPTANETPNQTRERLADLAAKYVDRAEFLKAISTGKGNAGSSSKFGDALTGGVDKMAVTDLLPHQSRLI